MEIRRFSSDLKTKVPGGHPGLYAVPIQTTPELLPPADKMAAYIERVNGMPLVLDTNSFIVAMYFEAHASIDEHSNDHNCVFLCIGGKGKIRIGGPAGETREIQAGDAVHWPANVDHTVWTEGEELQALVVEIFNK